MVVYNGCMAASQTQPITVPNAEEPASLAMLADALGSIDTGQPFAGLNATSISDNNGGRIEL